LFERDAIDDGHAAKPQATPEAVRASEPAPRSEPAIQNLTERQQKILAQLDGQPLPVDLLIERTGLAAQEILQDLTLLSLKGLVRRVDGQTYVRARRGGGGGAAGGER
jgi:predicted Rossmann fold nucleotide-binding protein DprA/Smf involved in DNA uptake